MSVKLFKLSVSRSIPKDKTLEEVEKLVNIVELPISYEEYIATALLWATEDLGETAKVLDVVRIVPKGGYIMGLFGGEKKKGKQRYAGLVVEDYKELGGVSLIKLVNLSKAYQVPTALMNQYGAGVYKLYYRGLVNPFKCKTLRVLLSSDDRNLKAFLEALIRLNQGSMTKQDENHLRVLINELKVSLDRFNEKSFYVVYRCQRAFTACVPEDLAMSVSESHISYIECKSLEQAYYYASVLNYLAYKVIELNRSFIRDQFARPVMAIAIAGLSWSRVPSEDRHRVAELSRKLSESLQWKEYTNQKRALEEISKTKEFRNILNILDTYVDKDGLDKALELVSTTSKEEEEE